MLEAYDALRIVGLDRDPAALEAARQRLSAYGDRVTLIAAPFSTLESILSRPGFVVKEFAGPVRVDFGYQLNPIPGLLVNGLPQTRQWRMHFSIGEAF